VSLNMTSHYNVIKVRNCLRSVHIGIGSFVTYVRENKGTM